jgi:hypothetical protein
MPHKSIIVPNTIYQQLIERQRPYQAIAGIIQELLEKAQAYDSLKVENERLNKRIEEITNANSHA